MINDDKHNQLKWTVDRQQLSAGNCYLDEITFLVCGWVVRKPVNSNPGLKVNRSINFSSIKMFFTSYFWFSVRLFKFKQEGETK